jgi:thiamine biosynthesis lipoprotein
VNIGGDIAVAGTAPRGGWPVKIADRHDSPADGPGPRVSIVSGGLASSGIAARRWQRGGQLLHHVIDPSTGLPATPYWRTVSVTADTCLAANVAATAAIIVGPDAPTWLSERGFHARLKAEQGTVVRVGDWPADDARDHDHSADGLGVVA